MDYFFDLEMDQEFSLHYLNAQSEKASEAHDGGDSSPCYLRRYDGSFDTK